MATYIDFENGKVGRIPDERASGKPMKNVPVNSKIPVPEVKDQQEGNKGKQAKDKSCTAVVPISQNPSAKKTLSYCMWQSQNVAGFDMKLLVGKPLAQQFHVMPLHRVNGLLISAKPLILGQTMERKSKHECQTLSFGQGKDKFFQATFLPVSNETCRVDVSIPINENKIQLPIGYIQWNQNEGIANGAQIIDCINNQSFKTRKRTSNDLKQLGIEIVNVGKGNRIVASCIGPYRGRILETMSSQISFANDITTNAIGETKLLFLCALMILIIEVEEVGRWNDLKRALNEIYFIFVILLNLIVFRFPNN